MFRCKNCGERLTHEVFWEGAIMDKKNKFDHGVSVADGLITPDKLNRRNVQDIKKYAAFEAMTGDSKFFDTIEDAEQWLVETWKLGATELEVEGGFIAKVLYCGLTENKLVKYEGDGE